jgi:hypothetical protein
MASTTRYRRLKMNEIQMKIDVATHHFRAYLDSRSRAPGRLQISRLTLAIDFLEQAKQLAACEVSQWIDSLIEVVYTEMDDLWVLAHPGKWVSAHPRKQEPKLELVIMKEFFIRIPRESCIYAINARCEEDAKDMYKEYFGTKRMPHGYEFVSREHAHTIGGHRLIEVAK